MVSRPVNCLKPDTPNYSYLCIIAASHLTKPPDQLLRLFNISGSQLPARVAFTVWCLVSEWHSSISLFYLFVCVLRPFNSEVI